MMWRVALSCAIFGTLIIKQRGLLDAVKHTEEYYNNGGLRIYNCSLQTNSDPY